MATKGTQEGSLQAPTRHPIDWKEEDFYNKDLIDKELERAFDICHGCRRCFNLCDSFPLLFDKIDASSTGEVDGLKKEDYKEVVDACTLCDMCFMVKCPYVPPHEFDLDFPHLMLRYRAHEFKNKKHSKATYQLVQADRNGKLGTKLSSVVNWSGKTNNKLTRPVLEKLLDVDKRAELPKYAAKTFKPKKVTCNKQGKAFGEKVVLFSTCFGNYNDHKTLDDTISVLHENGVASTNYYERCCGMPYFEQGDIAKVAENAAATAKDLIGWVNEGYKVVAPLASCALLMKFEWPLLLADDKNISKLAEHVMDAAEYIVYIDNKHGITPGLQPLDGGVTLHISCHTRAQNVGKKAKAMLALIPNTKVDVIERCSGHGGTWGYSSHNFERGLKVGKPVIRESLKQKNDYLVSECPLAVLHIAQGERLIETDSKHAFIGHPISLIARSYGF